jgi:hypothetical protein
MLMVRGVLPFSRSGRCNAASLRTALNQPELDNNKPPARCRQAPVRQGKIEINRTALPPPRTRCMP